MDNKYVSCLQTQASNEVTHFPLTCQLCGIFSTDMLDNSCDAIYLWCSCWLRDRRSHLVLRTIHLQSVRYAEISITQTTNQTQKILHIGSLVYLLTSTVILHQQCVLTVIIAWPIN